MSSRRRRKMRVGLFESCVSRLFRSMGLGRFERGSDEEGCFDGNVGFRLSAKSPSIVTIVRSLYPTYTYI